MTLHEIMMSGQYFQVYSVYITNTYDQNIPLARGTLTEILGYMAEEGDTTFFRHLTDKVEYYHITENKVMVVFVRDEHFGETVEYDYSEDYIAKWNNLDPKTRPFLHGIETEEYSDEWLCKFPNYEVNEQ